MSKIINKFQFMLEQSIKRKEKVLMDWRLDEVQGLFKIQDFNKLLRLKANTAQQIENAEQFDIQWNSIIEKLYVPSYQQENV